MLWPRQKLLLAKKRNRSAALPHLRLWGRGPGRGAAFLPKTPVYFWRAGGAAKMVCREGGILLLPRPQRGRGIKGEGARSAANIAWPATSVKTAHELTPSPLNGERAG